MHLSKDAKIKTVTFLRVLFPVRHSQDLKEKETLNLKCYCVT